MIKNKSNILLFGITLTMLFFVGIFLWILYDKVFSNVFSTLNFDETEYLKTHYQGVDCSSLKGSISFGDYGYPVQKACAGERAWYENNVEFCKIYSDDNDDDCFKWMAVKTGDLKICEMQKSKYSVSINSKMLEGEQQVLYGCYEYVAAYRDDPEICDLLPYTFGIQQCKEKSTDGKTYLQFKNSPIRPYCLKRDSNDTCTW